LTGLLTILILFGMGIVVGVVSGLIGIGGGVLIVPFLYFVYANPDFFGYLADPGTAVVIAHATSLFIIVPTAIRGALTYHRSNLVVWRAVWPIGIGSILAAMIGARLALIIPAEALQAGFGVLLLASGFRLGRKREPPTAEKPHRLRLDLPVTATTGAATGLFSALMGVGGGIVSMPLMLHWVGVDIQRLAATSIGIITITAPAGVLVYMLSAPQGLAPAGTVGHVHILPGVIILLGSVLAVRWGAQWNQRFSAAGLARLFAAAFMVIGAYLIWRNVFA